MVKKKLLKLTRVDYKSQISVPHEKHSLVFGLKAFTPLSYRVIGTETMDLIFLNIRNFSTFNRLL